MMCFKNVSTCILTITTTHSMFFQVMSCGFVPKITVPKRMCDTASTLIDNIYTNVLDKSTTSGIPIRPTSDPQTYLVS